MILFFQILRPGSAILRIFIAHKPIIIHDITSLWRIGKRRHRHYHYRMFFFHNRLCRNELLCRHKGRSRINTADIFKRSPQFFIIVHDFHNDIRCCCVVIRCLRAAHKRYTCPILLRNLCNFLTVRGHHYFRKKSAL